MRAIEDLRRAIQLDDSALDARVYLAGELARTGHRQEAIALLDDVLRRSPQHAEGRAALDALRTAGR
jgi:cytochrome c-type biogenesis protein CcmH/NrfG